MKGYHDISGDGGSNVLVQVGKLRERIAERLSTVRHRLAIGSGKGGVGKSTVTFGLAEALRARGFEVGILDADLNGPSQARLAGLQDAAVLPADSRILPPRTASGIRVLSLGSALPPGAALEFESVARGDAHTWRATREFALLGQLLASADWGRLDVLLFDLPPGAERTAQFADLLGPQTSFVLIAIPSELAREVVTRSVAALAGSGSRAIGYIENMNGYWCRDCGDLKPLFHASGGPAIPLDLLGSVPFDPALARASDLGEPGAASGSAAASALAAIAGRILERLEPGR